MITLKLLWRNWRSGELRILAAATLLAVMILSGILAFTDRLEQTLLVQSNSFLAADRLIKSSRPLPAAWFDMAQAHGLQHANTVEFSTMVFAQDHMHLAAVKAVSPRYPLRGQLETATSAFTAGVTPVLADDQIPPPGEAWVDARLLPLLGIDLNSPIQVGEATLIATRIIVREPDRGTGFFNLGARVMINIADLAATQAIQPGSRITYKGLIAGPPAALESYAKAIQGQLSEHEQWQDLPQAQQRIGKTLGTAQTFLVLTGIVGLLLSGIAIAVAAKQFAQRHIDQVALLKSLGMRASGIRRLYFLQLLFLAVIVCGLGVLIGAGVQGVIADLIHGALDIELASAGATSYLWGAGAGVATLLGFALPPLWGLALVPPVRVFRRDQAFESTRFWQQALVASLTIMSVILWFSDDTGLALAIMAGVLLTALLALLPARAFLALSQRLRSHASPAWRLALSSLTRNKHQSSLQIMVFALTLMLLIIITLVRTSLIREWQIQLPTDAPNHFLVNIAPEEVASVQSLLGAYHLSSTEIYPMVRARLTHINQQPLATDQDTLPRGVQRELNLSWSPALPEGNQILEGVWFDQWTPDSEAAIGVSVEARMASELGLALDDELEFSVGGLPMRARVINVRRVDWDSIRPNFYFMFSANALTAHSPTYLTSIHIPAEQKPFVYQLLKQHPTIVVLEMDTLIARIQTMILQVSQAIELLLWLILAGGALLLISTVNTSMTARRQEAALLRALGSRARLLQSSLWIEFSLLGLVAGILAAIGAEAVVMSLQKWVLQMTPTLHPLSWLAGPVAGASLIGLLGTLSCRHVLTTPPATLLRDAEH